MSSNIHSTHIDAPIRCLRHFHSRVVAFFGEFGEKVSDETWAVFAATQLKHTPNIASKLMKYRFDVGNLHNKLIIYILNNACEFSWNWCSLQSSAFCSFAWEMGEVYAVLCNICFLPCRLYTSLANPPQWFIFPVLLYFMSSKTFPLKCKTHWQNFVYEHPQSDTTTQRILHSV